MENVDNLSDRLREWLEENKSIIPNNFVNDTVELISMIQDHERITALEKRVQALEDLMPL